MSELATDTATGLALGRRARQEDALVSDFPAGRELGFAVLSDGMGGHGSGDLASRIIVSEVFGDLIFLAAQPDAVRKTATDILRRSMDSANARLRDHAEADPENRGMGGTLISTLVMDGTLRWLSVGDSPLYLFRDRTMTRLNADHSMAPRIDALVKRGLIDAESGRTHPQRHCLTSALTGENVGEVDCPDEPYPLAEGDVIVMASDGVQVLDDRRIGRIIARNRRFGSRRIADALLAAVRAKDEPHQDNVSLVVIRMVAAPAEARAGLARRVSAIADLVSDLPRRLRIPARGLNERTDP
ncbi:MAG: PP2C family protein-serine/threonine phosphatase [Pseudooceanicola sp.]